MKKMKLLFVSLMLLAFGVTSVSAQDYASTNTSNVTFTLGTKANKEKMNIGGTQYDVVKLGTKNAVGDASFKIPAGTTTIHLHAVAWNGTTAQINFTASSNSVTLGTTSITPKSDSGAANKSPYTLAGDPTSYYYEITTSNVTAETTITMKTVSGKTRAIIWGVNTEIATTGDDDDAVMYTVTASVNDETMGSVSGAGKYAEGKTATLTANPNAGYKFVNWSNGETANPLKFTVTEDVEITANFAAIPPITCSQIKDLTIGEAFVLGEFTVTYVNGAYTYIKDATGASLIYSYNYGLKAGDVVTGLAGTRANFNGLVQINPTVTKAQLTITAGTAPQPEVATANPTQADMNKYVKYEQVTFDATAFSSKKINATLAGQTTKFAVYDQWSFNKTFVKGGTYEFIGAVSYYNAVQVNFISATKVSLTISATATGGKVTGTGEYMEGDEATLTAIPAEGYEFTCWTAGKDTVSTENSYTFTVTADVALVANFAVVEPEVIAYELNGGELPTATVPTQEELWASFKTATGLDTKALSELSSPVLNTIAGLLKGTTWYKGFDVLEWKWLKSYIQTIQANQAGQQFVDANGTTRTVVELKDDISSDDNWRFAVAAFFAQSQYVGWPKATADFTEAGKPEAWGAAYQAAHAVVLPTEPVAEDYVLPTPVKTGYTFVGWYDNAEGTGEAYTVIPAGWSGTLYAIWKQSPATALENIAVEGKVVKAIINGQLIIVKNGVQYNAQGQVIK